MYSCGVFFIKMNVWNLKKLLTYLKIVQGKKGAKIARCINLKAFRFRSLNISTGNERRFHIKMYRKLLFFSSIYYNIYFDNKLIYIYIQQHNNKTIEFIIITIQKHLITHKKISQHDPFITRIKRLLSIPERLSVAKKHKFLKKIIK